MLPGGFMGCLTVRKTILMGVIFFLGSITVAADWVRTTGPGGGDIDDIAVSGKNVFARTQDLRLFISRNNGATWNEADSTFKYVKFLAANGGTVVTYCLDSTMTVSTDSGATWTKIHSDFLDSISNVDYMEMSGNTLFTVKGYGIYCSTDNGGHWKSITGILPDRVYSIAAYDSIIAANLHDNRTMLSLNSGSSWNSTFSCFVYDLIKSGTTLLAATTKGILRSTDNGATWTTAHAGLTDTIAQCLAVNGNTFFAGTSDGIFRSDNGGTGWVKVNMGASNVWVNSIAVGNNVLLAGTDDGIFLSTDSGSNWKATNSGLFNVTTLSIVNYGASLFAGTEGRGVYRSTDSGENWIRLYSCPRYASGKAVKIGKKGIYVLQGSEIYLSADNGMTWTRTNSGFITENVWSFCADNDRFLLGAGPNIFQTTDTDTAWSVIPSSPGLIIAITACDSVICAGTIGGIYLSTNSGLNWKKFDYTDLSNFGWHTTALAIYGDTIFAGTEGGGVFLTNRAGTIWENCTTGLTNYSKSVMSFAQCDNRVFAGTYEGVYLSTNNGTSWKEVNTGLGEMPVTSLAVFNGNLFAATQSRGVWKRPLSEMTGAANVLPNLSSIQPAKSHQIDIRQGCNGIHIALSHVNADWLNVKILDLSGRERASFVDKYYNKGSYNYLWDTRNVANGCYLLSIQTGSKIFTKSITILK
jgi:photosystem II stability/assembly factor-like uncharacterized protein